MGCDIHIVLEQKVEDAWMPINLFRAFTASSLGRPDNKAALTWPLICERNYDRFAKLASVRGESERKPLGYPADVSPVTRHFLDSEGDHSASWISLSEALPIFLSTNHEPLSDFATKYPASHFFGVEDEQVPDACPTCGHVKNYRGTLNEYRLVFNFDS